MRQSGVPTRHRAHLQPRPASPPGSLTVWKGALRVFPRPRGDSPPRCPVPSQASWGLTAAGTPSHSRCEAAAAGGRQTTRERSGVSARARLGAGARVTRWTPTKVESHILITLGSRTRLPAGRWVGGEGFVEPSASVLPERAQAPVLTSPQNGRWGDPFATRHCQSAFRRPRPGAPLERGALGGATKHTGACPQRSHVGAGRRCTDLGAERD